MIAIDLSGKTILMTGALGAIAEHMVRRLGEAGATLALTDIKAEEAAQRTLDEWKIPRASYSYFAADIADADAVERLVEQAFERWPALDTVLWHAGGCGLHPFATTSAAEYERIFRFNYFAQTYLARATLAQWTKHGIAGHLIFTSSYVARMPHTKIPAYASAKAALENFARCLALEYAATGIRVNVVLPGNAAAGSSLKVLNRMRLTGNSCCGCRWAGATARSQSRTRSCFCVRRSPAKLTGKCSARTTAGGSATGYENRSGPL